MKRITVTSDYSNLNKLVILQKDDGDIVLHTIIRDEKDRNIEIALDGSRLKNNLKIIGHFKRIIELLEQEDEDIVEVTKG